MSNRILIRAGVALVVSFLMLLLGGYAVGSFGHIYVFFFLLIEFGIFLALLAVATWVVATVWKAVMRQG